MKDAVIIKNVNFSYEKVNVLEDVNLILEEGDFAAVIGPNGGGKTTLVKIIMGIIKPDTGSAELFGRNPLKVRSSSGYVPQFIEVDGDFPIPVIDVVLGGLLKPSSFFPWDSTDLKDRASRALGDVGLSGLDNRIFGTLSGGQRQRVLIARAIVSKPKILILDEPTTSVDSSNEMDIFKLLQKLNAGMTIVLVTHELGFISTYVNKVVCVNRRVSISDTSSIDRSVIEDTYNRPMNLLVHKCGL